MLRHESAIPVREVGRSGADAEFTSVTSLDVDSRGRVYVGDWYRQQVTVLDGDGAVARMIGRRGEGPGEFRSIRGVQVLPGDSLLVYDPTLGRFSVFGPDEGAPAYVRTLAERLEGPAPFLLWRTPENDAMVALFRPQFMFRTGAASPPRFDHVSLLDAAGAPVRPRVLRFPSKSFLVADASVTPNPFGREGIVRSGRGGRLLHVWTDSAAVATHDGSGNRVSHFALPFTAAEVTEADTRSALEAMGTQGAAMFERTLQDSLPARWPAVREMLVDDEARIWLSLASSSATAAEWAVLSDAGSFLGSVVLPAGVELRAVHGQKLYAVQLDDSDVPRVVIYHLERAPGH